MHIQGMMWCKIHVMILQEDEWLKSNLNSTWHHHRARHLWSDKKQAEMRQSGHEDGSCGKGRGQWNMGASWLNPTRMGVAQGRQKGGDKLGTEAWDLLMSVVWIGLPWDRHCWLRFLSKRLEAVQKENTKYSWGADMVSVDGMHCGWYKMYSSDGAVEQWQTSADASLEGGVNFVGDGMLLRVALEDGKWGTGGYPGARALFVWALSLSSVC